MATNLGTVAQCPLLDREVILTARNKPNNGVVWVIYVRKTHVSLYITYLRLGFMLRGCFGVCPVESGPCLLFWSTIVGSKAKSANVCEGQISISFTV